MADLLTTDRQIEELSYEYTLTTVSGVMNGSVWIQGRKIKTEATVGGQRIISIYDGDTNIAYTYCPDRNRAIKFSAEAGAKNETPGVYTGRISLDGARILTKGVCGGVLCKVMAVVGPESGDQIKIWMREDYGLPIRMEITAPDGSKTLMEYKKMQVGPLPPDNFELPSGVEVIDLIKVQDQPPRKPRPPGCRP